MKRYTSALDLCNATNNSSCNTNNSVPDVISVLASCGTVVFRAGLIYSYAREALVDSDDLLGVPLRDYVEHLFSFKNLVIRHGLVGITAADLSFSVLGYMFKEWGPNWKKEELWMDSLSLTMTIGTLFLCSLIMLDLRYTWWKDREKTFFCI